MTENFEQLIYFIICFTTVNLSIQNRPSSYKTGKKVFFILISILFGLDVSFKCERMFEEIIDSPHYSKLITIQAQPTVYQKNISS